MAKLLVAIRQHGDASNELEARLSTDCFRHLERRAHGPARRTGPDRASSAPPKSEPAIDFDRSERPSSTGPIKFGSVLLGGAWGAAMGYAGANLASDRLLIDGGLQSVGLLMIVAGAVTQSTDHRRSSQTTSGVSVTPIFTGNGFGVTGTF